MQAPLPAPRPRARRGHYHGDGRDVLLQGFHWHSHFGAPDPASGGTRCWYRILIESAPAIRDAGFTRVWFPPPSDSLAPQGYIPRRWDVLDSAYGREAELREAIAAIAPARAMADVVLNHRVGAHTSGADFECPAFPDNRAAVVRNDESGVGTGAYDTGELHPAGRDLDHTNPDVRAAVKRYLERLRSVGFKDWRYDLVKGFHGRYVAEYNDATAPGLSVGECYDGCRQKVCDWVDSTGGKSMAFDFPLRFQLFDALARDDYAKLRTWSAGKAVPCGLIGFWASRAVTFLDNHDTEYRREAPGSYHDEGTRHFPGAKVQQGYAYLLTHPGVPCVFWSHYFEWGGQAREVIARLMQLRREAGLHADSTPDIREAAPGLYAATIDGRVAVKLGTRGWWPGGGWRLVVDGERFAVWAR
jgi:alpha-amylase